MVPLTNQEVYQLINKENEKNNAFIHANPQFNLDNSNIASSVYEIEYFENLYSNMECGLYEYTEKDFHFKRADRYTFQNIFSDNWSNFIADNPSFPIRNVMFEEVNKMISCQDPNLGHAIYECPQCHETFCVPFTCKSRFCNTCAVKYQMDRALEISSKLINCKHRHMVFTIPKELRPYFLYDYKLLTLLFKAVENTLSFYFFKRAKSKKFKPGIVLVLHTFGRDLKWNPHIHCLVTQGASSNVKNCPKNDIWINMTYFNYESLRKSFRKALLDIMQSTLSTTLPVAHFKKFKVLVNYLYKQFQYGFYVRAKPFEGSVDTAIKYLLRYFNRPPMAQSRILYYDGSYVVFYYQRHEDNMYVIEKVPVYQLISRLIIHIPEKHFKMLRYAGIYSSHKCVHWHMLIKKLSDIAIKTRKQLANWRNRIEVSFHYDPLKCPFCINSIMTLSNIFIAKVPP